MRTASLSCLVLLAGCATAQQPEPPPAHAEQPRATIPTIWPIPATEFGRCPTCGQPVPTYFPRPLTPPPVLDADEALRRASAGGRYRELLRKVEVPNDWLAYGAFCDWGFWSGTSYAGLTDLPPGHWVYVHPDWYVWGETTGAPAVR